MTKKDNEFKLKLEGLKQETILKRKVIDWIKEDKEVTIRLHPADKSVWEISIGRWMDRFDITERDLE